MAELVAGLVGPLQCCISAPQTTHNPVIPPKKPYEIPYDGDESTRAARQAIDQGLADIELQKRSLRMARNRLSPISVLPPEVLSKIFIFIRDSALDIYVHHLYSTHWIRSVGHICHHWREVALNCATLWSAPIFANPELVREMMRRSKQATLTIEVTTSSWTLWMLNEIENVVTQIFRIRILRLSCGSHSDKLDAAFSQPAPRLEQLMLFDNVYSLHNSHYHLLPDSAFADAPRLRSVELERFNFSWTAAVFKHNLTNLMVKKCPMQDNSTFIQLLEALNHMPNLQTLHLAQCLPCHTTVNGNEPTLDFPALRSLEVDSRGADCAQFLRCIKYPPITVVRLNCTSLIKVDDYAHIFACISGGSHNTSTPSISRVFRSAYFQLDSDLTVTIYLYTRSDAITVPSYYFMGPQDGCAVALRFICNSRDELSFGNVLKESHRFIDLNSLEALELDWFSHLRDIKAIRETIGKLPKLEYLRVGSLGTQALHAIQSSSDPAPTTERARTGRPKKEQFKPLSVTVFPILKSLCLRNMDLNEMRSPGTLQVVIDTLMHRSNIDAPVQILELQDCRGVQVEQKRLLGELVVDLLVNGESVDVLELDSEGEVVSEEDEWDEDEDEMYGDGMYDEDYFDEDMYNGGFGFVNPFAW